MTKHKAIECLATIINHNGFAAVVGGYGLPEVPVTDDSFVAIYIQPKWDESEKNLYSF